MKVSAVIVSRNDDYGGNLKERSSYCFQSSENIGEIPTHFSIKFELGNCNMF